MMSIRFQLSARSSDLVCVLLVHLCLKELHVMVTQLGRTHIATVFEVLLRMWRGDKTWHDIHIHRPLPQQADIF